jgi:hypothetical protein
MKHADKNILDADIYGATDAAVARFNDFVKDEGIYNRGMYDIHKYDSEQ